MSVEAAQTYLVPQSHAFWEWDLSERSVHWLTGTTIAFPQELVAVLERLSVRGLPRFDCILLVLAALRDSWFPYNKNLKYLSLQMDCYKYATLSDREALHLIHQLDRLNALPRELRLSLPVKTVLCDMVLEVAESRCTRAGAALVLSGLRERREDVPSQAILSVPAEQLDWWRLDLLSLSEGLERVDERRLRSRLATGLDEQVQTVGKLADETFSDAMEARELMETLLQDREHHSLGRLAKDLLAALYRPAPLVPEKSLPMEGYSDITNRGTLDRLLLSELAYDNDTLAVRIANSEALYMRREVPLSSESVDRFLLIDCGIRSWGTPRVYNAAIALALTASAPCNSQVLAWRAVNGGLERSFFIDQSGLNEHMSSLDAGLHPGPVLDAFHEQMAVGSTNREVYIILSRDAWNDQDFRTALHHSKISCLTAAVVDRFGALELITYSRSGLTIIKNVALSLKGVHGNSIGAPAPLIANEKLPRIFHCNPFPLRLAINNSRYHAVDAGLLLGKAHGNRLVLWDNVNQGGVTLQLRLPYGDIAWSGRDAERQTLVVVCRNGSSNKYAVMRFDLQNYAMIEKSEIVLQSDALHFSLDGRWLIVCDKKRQQTQAWNIANGTLIDTLKGPHLERNFFQNEAGAWMAVHFNGLGFDVNPVSFQQELHFDKIAFVMVAPQKDGYVAMTSSGRILHSKGSDLYIQNTNMGRIVDGDVLVSGDNRWISFGTQTGRFVVEVMDDGTPGKCIPFKSPAYDSFSQHLVWGVRQQNASVSQKSYRNRFHRVAVFDGDLTLLRNQRSLRLQFVNRDLRWVESLQVISEPLQTKAVFFENDRDLSREVGFRLEFARKNQVEAVLDARGLLHLRSLNSLFTEITLTINVGLASGWTSDGRFFGSAYHCGGNAFTPVKEIYSEVLCPLLQQFSGGLL